jgi:hypothetical protein
MLDADQGCVGKHRKSLQFPSFLVGRVDQNFTLSAPFNPGVARVLRRCNLVAERVRSALLT